MRRITHLHCSAHLTIPLKSCSICLTHVSDHFGTCINGLKVVRKKMECYESITWKVYLKIFHEN